MKTIVTLLLTFIAYFSFGQTLTGHFDLYANNRITLYGFDYYKKITLGSAQSKADGTFILEYPETYVGAAELHNGNDRLIVLLNGADITISGADFMDFASIKVGNSTINTNLYNYFKYLDFRKRVEPAWLFLKKNYTTIHQNTPKDSVLSSITTALDRLVQTEERLTEPISNQPLYNSYISNIRKMQSLNRAMTLFPENLEDSQNLIFNIDYTDKHIKHLGIFPKLVNSHFKYLEATDNKTVNMQNSINTLLPLVNKNVELGKSFTTYLYRWLEGRSHFNTAAYFSQRILTNYMHLTTERINLEMQKYVRLKPGNKAPNIVFNDSSLHDYNTPVVLVFGPGNCKKCKEESLNLFRYYYDWKKRGIETISIILNTNSKLNKNLFSKAPWLSYTDLEIKNPTLLKDYAIYKQPTYLILDRNQNILIHGKTTAHVNSWINIHFKDSKSNRVNK